MKYVYLITSIIFICSYYKQSVSIKNKDNVTNYEMMKSGTFIQQIKNHKASAEYYMILKDSLRIEYSEKGKYFTKSIITRNSKATFTSIAYESSIPGFNNNIKELVETEILETSTKDSLILIRERSQNSKWSKFLLKKIKS